MNTSGDVLGSGFDGDAITTHLLLFHAGSTTDLGNLGGNQSLFPQVLTDSGVVAGSVLLDDAGNGFPFLWQAGTLTKLQPLSGDRYGVVYSISPTGLVAGSSVGGTNSQPVSRAVLWSGSTAIDLNRLVAAPGCTLEVVHGTNAKGQLVGWGQVNGHRHAFLLTPK
jgi:uncharacterized membrane protein